MSAQTELLLARARERFVAQDYYGAVHLLDTVVDSGRAFADVHHLLGVCLSLLGQPERALRELDRALELNPRYMEALIHRGLVLNELGRTEEAEEAFASAGSQLERSTAGLPTPIAAQLANRHADLAESYAGAGALDRAIAEYERALELGPEFHDLRYRKARLLLETGRSLDAREELEKILAARPSFVDAEAALGLARYLSGDAAGARDVWQACLARRPENARVEAYLSMLARAEA
jgi:tetratricopeptide (TPR) repeat protein